MHTSTIKHMLTLTNLAINHASDNHAYDRPLHGPWAKTNGEWRSRKARRLSLVRGVHTSTVAGVTKRPPKVNTKLGTGMKATSHDSAPNTFQIQLYNYTAQDIQLYTKTNNTYLHDRCPPAALGGARRTSRGVVIAEDHPSHGRSP